MPGTLSIFKPCDKCRRKSQTTEITSVELPKGQMLLFKKYELGFEKTWGSVPNGQG